MKLPRIIFYICLCIFSAMMNFSGFGLTSWQYWIGATLIIASHICGMEYGEAKCGKK